MTRRKLIGSIAATAMAAAAEEPRKEWTPKLGVLGPYTRANVEFARKAGFKNLIANGGIRASQISEVKQVLQENGIGISAFQLTVNHIDPDPSKRAKINAFILEQIEVAGQLGVPYIGSASGADRHKSFPEQVDEIVRLYNEKYFDACRKNNVKILWEPWPEGPNIATSPAGYRALFKAFGDSAPVGLQFDPSHAVRQFMDPIETAREFVHRIYDVHLKDTEILWPVLHDSGINPVNGADWWRYRIPGMGTIDWRAFFSILQDVGYSGAMSIEQEDSLYGADNNPGPDFSEEFKMGFVMAKRYLDQYVP